MSIFNHFKHLELTADQKTAIEELEKFLASDTSVFLLKGYAGSGKTTIIKGLVEYLQAVEKRFMVMAPTGRAAKVLRDKTGVGATTIHKGIYGYEDLLEVEDGDSFFYYFNIRNNDDVFNQVFIVDEASMLSDAKSEGEFFRFGSGHLLTDLITFTRISTKSARTKIIFVGDPCQLPPVNDNRSKAFDPDYLKEKFQVSVEEAEMKEVKRQGGDSGILNAAAKIRRSISAGFFNDFNLTGNGKDIFNPSYGSLLQTWDEAGTNKIIITNKNKTALDLNLQIRERKYGDGNLPLQKGDIVIVSGNNYRKGIVNGEFAVVNEAAPVVTTESVRFYPKTKDAKSSTKPQAVEIVLTWRMVELIFPDNPEESKVVRGQMLENFLQGENALAPEEMQALYINFKNRNPGLKPKTKEFKDALFEDAYFNCILLKYGYAVTCHKAQGGEWENVITIWDHDNTKGFNWLQDEQTKKGKDNENFYRWAYTAITRASEKLYAVNPPRFDSYSTMTFTDQTVLASLAELSGANSQPTEIVIDQPLIEKLKHLQLIEQPVQLQDHYIAVRELVRAHYIEITKWKRNNYEVLFWFTREGKLAVYKTWFNGDLQFKKPFVQQPVAGSDSSLVDELSKLLVKLPSVNVIRNTSETILTQLDFELEIEEKYPFTKLLFDDLQESLATKLITIDSLEHQQFCERYTFRRGAEKTVVNFWYDRNGFWKKVVSDEKRTNSKALLKDTHESVTALKNKILMV